MEREIIFRGKRIDNGEWVEGSYFKILDSECFFKEILEFEFPDLKEGDLIELEVIGSENIKIKISRAFIESLKSV